MDFKKLEKEMYNNEEFMACLPIMQKEYWDKAKPTKRAEFFDKFMKIVHSVDETYPDNIMLADLKDDLDQTIIVGSDAVLMDRVYFSRTINPYDIMASIIFELSLEDNFRYSETDKAKRSKLGKQFIVNNCSSIFDNWTNFYSRKNPEFNFQPLTHEANNVAYHYVYNLLRYMNKNYKMDKYIGTTISRFMLRDFSVDEKVKRVEKNYKEMEKNYKLNDIECEQRDNIFAFLDSKRGDIELLSDEDLLSLFNDKLVYSFYLDARVEFYREFVRRFLSEYEDVAEYAESIKLVESSNGLVLVVGGSGFLTDEMSELDILVNNMIGIKIENNLLKEINDEKLKEEAQECLHYIKNIKKANMSVQCKYLQTGFAYVECLNYLKDYYHNLIKEAIKNNKLFNEGEPLVKKGNFSKYNEFLKFAYDKDYETVRREQFEDLKADYENLVGGR